MYIAESKNTIPKYILKINGKINHYPINIPID